MITEFKIFENYGSIYEIGDHVLIEVIISEPGMPLDLKSTHFAKIIDKNNEDYPYDVYIVQYIEEGKIIVGIAKTNGFEFFRDNAGNMVARHIIRKLYNDEITKYEMGIDIKKYNL